MSFPLNSNQAYIKDTGERTTLGAVVGGGGGGGSDLPEYSIANAGQVLTVDDTGELAWGEVQGGGYVFTSNNINPVSPTTIAQEVTT